MRTGARARATRFLSSTLADLKGLRHRIFSKRHCATRHSADTQPLTCYFKHCIANSSCGLPKRPTSCLTCCSMFTLPVSSMSRRMAQRSCAAAAPPRLVAKSARGLTVRSQALFGLGQTAKGGMYDVTVKVRFRSEHAGGVPEALSPGPADFSESGQPRHHHAPCVCLQHH